MAKAVISGVRNQKVGFIKTAYYPKSNIYDKSGRVKINAALPFRVKFINVGVPSYSGSNVPPIGIAIIGVNNYIL